MHSEINGIELQALDGEIENLYSFNSVAEKDGAGLHVHEPLLHQAQGKGIPEHVLRLKVFIENVRRDYLTAQDIDRLIVQGDCYYKQIKRTLGENHRHGFLTVNEVVEYLKLENETFKIESHFVDYGVYPSSDNDLRSCTEDLKDKLPNLFENYADSGFIFIGLNVAVSHWKCNSRYFLFDSHAVNVNGTLSSDGVGRLLAFCNLKEIARSPFNGSINQHEITRVVTRGQEPQCSRKRPIPPELKAHPKLNGGLKKN